jgi:hypothetical protein
VEANMNRKILALIIFIVAIAGVYGLFYGAVTTVLMPQDLNTFKTELDAMSQSSITNDSSIVQTESSAAIMESYSPLNGLSQSQRTEMANKMRINNATIPQGVLNQNFTEYNTYNNYKAMAYSLILKGDISSGINNLSSTYENINQLGSEMVSLNQKMAADFENGDNKAYADDLRSTTTLTKQYNHEMAILKTQLQTLVNQLSS